MRENLLPGIELVNGDCAAVLPELPPADLILTSPPYDNLREYGGHNNAFRFDAVAAACIANLAPGGVLVWVTKDTTAGGKESGTSFRQVCSFMDLGLDLHHTMIYECWSLAGMRGDAYFSQFFYMFVLSQGKPRTANMIKDKFNAKGGMVERGSFKGRHKDSKSGAGGAPYRIHPIGKRGNIWRYDTVPNSDGMNGDLGGKALEIHPARFPPQLARDHILSWTNPGDLVIDPMVGSGTTLRAAEDLVRRAIGIEINPEYCDLIRRRMAQSVLPMEG